MNKSKAARLKRFFRITPAEAERVRVYQEWHPQYSLLLAKEGKLESFDHRHKDGLLRGWLAIMLNKAYGHIENLYGEDTSKVLRALADYHDSPPAKELLGARYGIIGLAKKKAKYVYGPPEESK